MTLKLYGDRFWVSPFVFSCYVTLKEKALPFEMVELALDKHEARTPAWADKTLTGKIPALEHDGFVLAESSAIIEYLDDVFPSVRALPAEVKARARARQVMAWLRTDMDPLREARSTTSMFYEHVSTPLPPAAQAAADRLLGVSDRLIADGASSLFGAWSVADSELAFMLQRLGLNGHELPKKLRAFVDAAWSRPSVRSYVERPRAPFVPY